MSQVVLITGANGGLGNAVTSAFLSCGATVAGVSRTIKPSDFTGCTFGAFPADLTSSAEATRVVLAIKEAYGRIDALIHLMGGYAGGAVDETNDETWASMQDLNLTSAFNIFRTVLPIMREQRQGRIIAVGSLAAQPGAKGLAGYTVFKTALRSLVQVTAAENGEYGITANIVVPGTMDTPGNRAFGKDSKWIPPEAVANVILFLASEEAGYVSGAEIPIRERGR